MEIQENKSFTNSLELGNEGQEVNRLQRILKTLGYFNLEYTTNYFGEITEEALIKFQLANNIISSQEDYGAGYLGPKTRAALNRL